MILSNETLQLIRQLPIEMVVGKYLSLKKSGMGLEAHCPFHNERTPSFKVHRGKNIFKCFGCGLGGDAITFVMLQENLCFADAVRRIAEIVGENLENVPSVPLGHWDTWDKRCKDAQPQAGYCYLPWPILKHSVGNHRNNYFYSFLNHLFTAEVATMLCKQYCIGTLGNGLTAFFQVDINGNICQARVIDYPDPKTGKRSKVKDPILAGKKLLGGAGRFRQCFFGEHLLKDKSRIVAIPESEKSAVIASVYCPEFDWLATGGVYGGGWYQKERCKVLEGRAVVLYPDLGKYNEWCELAKQVRSHVQCSIVVSDYLERNFSHMKPGYDIADYLLSKRDETGLAMTNNIYPVIWDYPFTRDCVDTESSLNKGYN